MPTNIIDLLPEPEDMTFQGPEEIGDERKNFYIREGEFRTQEKQAEAKPGRDL